jgi:tetratricopeptide (TPR) repeat protein
MDWAIANYTRALSLEPNNADAYYGRATAQTNAKNYLGATEDLDRTIQLEPNKVNAYLDRSKSKQQTYDYVGSLTDATKVINLTTESELKSDAYYVRSIAQFNQGNYTEALNDLNQSTSLNYQEKASLAYKCSIEARAAQPNALKTCEEAASIQTTMGSPDPSLSPETIEEGTQIPAELSVYRCLARAQNKDPKAFQDCGNAINQEAENPIVYEVQGLARIAAGNKKGAIFSLEKALKLYTILGDQTAIDRVQTAINQN